MQKSNFLKTIAVTTGTILTFSLKAKAASAGLAVFLVVAAFAFKMNFGPECSRQRIDGLAPDLSILATGGNPSDLAKSLIRDVRAGYRDRAAAIDPTLDPAAADNLTDSEVASALLKARDMLSREKND